ncbi:hypothetical protein PG994_005125 [Apiospora phragmitis]|uniref:Uncharacterized protein n=1 Tax=Apiospora phragmitis TaxID=2905665 RepID=A0ABR1VV83_9PEZI
MSSFLDKADAKTFIFWLRSRQDAIDIAANFLANDTTADAAAVKERLAALFHCSADNSKVFSNYGKNQAEQSSKLRQQKSDLEAQVQSLREYQTQLVGSVNGRKELLRKSRLDAAELEQAVEYQKHRFSSMQYFFKRQQKVRDQARGRVRAEAQARLESLRIEHVGLRAENQELKAALASAQRERDEFWQHASRVAKLEEALEAAHEENSRLTDVVNEYAADEAVEADSTPCASILDRPMSPLTELERRVC